MKESPLYRPPLKHSPNHSSIILQYNILPSLITSDHGLGLDQFSPMIFPLVRFKILLNFRGPENLSVYSQKSGK